MSWKSNKAKCFAVHHAQRLIAEDEYGIYKRQQKEEKRNTTDNTVKDGA